ncbi:hypothetical protein M2137_003015 [Parabacteroides sp. PFB2-10]|uniref:DNA alkylation repair protein n=1 Tax=Parabacteroides sp. PFB2-10 TaxID=1742405 RepID=UPI002474423C|nr:DNA alkylation repair protein [Parabacteroides sp. PFB2-10]MDH6314218.1 hypothetical protein [Parabacteroides sp. PFB2-10]MDL2244192.1 DNA alkylation repair protein [Parabacteroides sp. OttesenSCG-928-J18]
MELKEIRKQLRLAMNGVVSTSMRQKGVGYKINFGVSLPQLKTIAATHTPDSTLAETLWKEDIREMKILAILLYPRDEFDAARAEAWAMEIADPEIAGHFCFLLLQHLSFSEELAMRWIKCREGFFRQMGFLLLAHLFRNGDFRQKEYRIPFSEEARTTVRTGSLPEKQAAAAAVKRYGSQSKEQAVFLLELFKTEEGSPEGWQEFQEELQFEFENYL